MGCHALLLGFTNPCLSPAAAVRFFTTGAIWEVPILKLK